MKIGSGDKSVPSRPTRSSCPRSLDDIARAELVQFLADATDPEPEILGVAIMAVPQVGLRF
ncbi:hypothetical protein AAE026_13190 [Bradyrhizobium sp. DN5]|uniref:hypothetical protein n=1 Tax=Bradyrhizobium sp. DN5 TaxID=3056950 RepID=UPI003524B335